MDELRLLIRYSYAPSLRSANTFLHFAPIYVIPHSLPRRGRFMENRLRFHGLIFQRENSRAEYINVWLSFRFRSIIIRGRKKFLNNLDNYEYLRKKIERKIRIRNERCFLAVKGQNLVPESFGRGGMVKWNFEYPVQLSIRKRSVEINVKLSWRREWKNDRGVGKLCLERLIRF